MSARRDTAASRLKRQLVLEEEVLTADGMGGHTRVWSEVATLWAEIRPLGGREVPFASQLGTTQRFRITVRYRSDITPLMRFRSDEDGRVFNIRSVSNLEEGNHLLEILAERVTP